MPKKPRRPLPLMITVSPVVLQSVFVVLTLIHLQLVRCRAIPNRFPLVAEVVSTL